MKVVLYAEGAGETVGELGHRGAPGVRLEEDELGAGHVLVRRSLAARKNMPEQAVVFSEPLRNKTGRPAQGSDLLNPTTLRQLLTWPRAEQRPNLVVVLVDCDGERQRKSQLQAAIESSAVPHVVGMAIQEFEAWLLADQKAVVDVFGAGTDQPPAMESLERRRAKETLKQWVADLGKPDHDREIRKGLATQCNIEAVAKACPAFADFLVDLERATLA